MPQHNIDVSWSSGPNSTDQVQQRVTKTAQSGISIGDTASPLIVPGAVGEAPGTVDMQLDVAIDVSQLKSLFIRSTADLLIETNSGSEADDTLTLVANEPLVWWEGCGWSCPLTVDVTAMFLTRTEQGDADVQLRFLVDPTP